MGPARKKVNAPEKEAYNLALAQGLKSRVSCSIICVGGFRSRNVAEKAVSQNQADFISMSRPLIREPDLPRKWQENQSDRSQCISCNKCFIPGLTKGGIYCVPQKKQDEA